MRVFYLGWIVLVVTATSCAHPARPGSEDTGAVRPVALRCEYLTDPMGIDTPRPRLSWALESAARDQRQTAYRIVVEDERGIRWDSGEVRSAEQLHVPYGGTALRSRERLTWRVTVWDRDGKASAPSPAASWEMGLLEPPAWQAKWIGSERGVGDVPAPAPFLRKTFTLSRPVRTARAYVTGAGYFELHANGNKVGDRVLDPGFTAYDRRMLYVTFDLTPLLRAGENVLGLVLGNGFFNPTTPDQWSFQKASWRGAPRGLVQLHLEYADGTSEIITTDESWRWAAGPITWDQIRGGESHDARRALPGWSGPGFRQDARWAPATVLPAPGGVLSAHMLPPSRVTQTLPARAVATPRPGVFVFDFGQNLAGWARVSLAAPAGTTVTLRYGERVTADGALDAAQISSLVKGRFQRDEYTFAGGGVETWEPRFTYHGFRYVEVSGLPAAPPIAGLVARVVHTDFPRIGHFESSSPLLARIYEATLWSYRSNFVQGIPTDCPHREKNGWTADAHLAAEQAMFNFDNAAGYTKWIRDIVDAMKPTGELPGIVPTGGWGYTWGNGPAWDSALFVIPFYLHLYTGDRDVLTSHHAAMARYLDYVGTRDYMAENPKGWLGDWVPARTRTPEWITHAGYHAFDARVLRTVASWRGDREAEARHRATVERVTAAFRARFAAAEGAFAPATQTALATAVYQDLLEGQERSRALAALVADVESANKHLDCGCLGAKYLPWALTEAGRADLVYALVTQKDHPGWGNWFEQGATTLWEDWRGNGSRNHIFLGDISAWFFRALAGINPDPAGPGFARIVIRPEVIDGLDFVRADTKTARGLVAAGWRRDGSGLVLDVTVPVNSTATVFVPAHRPDQISVQGATFLQTEGERQVYAVGSGHTTFHVRQWRR